MTPSPRVRRLRAQRPAIAASAALLVLCCSAAADAQAPLTAPAGPWPTAVPDATNPLTGTPYTLNGGHASADADLRVWLTWKGHRHRTSVKRSYGDATFLVGRLRDRGTGHAISGAMLELAGQSRIYGWRANPPDVRTDRRGFFRTRLSNGPNLSRVAILYWPSVNAPAPVFSRRLLLRTRPRVDLDVTAHGRSVLLEGRVRSGARHPRDVPAVVQVRRNRSWVSVQRTPLRFSGRFSMGYRFGHRHHRYLVRVIVPAQPGSRWPFYAGISQTRVVRT